MRYMQADVSHAQALTALRLEMRKERDATFDPGTLQESTLDYFQRNLARGSLVVFACEEDGHLIATVGLSLFEMPPTAKLKNGKVMKLMNMYTLPSHRGNGIAKALLDLAKDYGKRNAYYKIMLNSSPMGLALYEKAGFTPIQNEYELFLD